MIKAITPLFFALLLATHLAIAGDRVSYQNWELEIGNATSEAYTIGDAHSSLGVFCSGGQCLFYLRQGFNCSTGTKYSVLMNSISISTALNMECTLIGGNLFQILTPFDDVLKATQIGGSIGFAVALQSGDFAVTRFSLLGAKSAIDRALVQAAMSGQRKQAVPSPQMNVAPPVLINPQTPQNRAPQLQPKSSSKEVST